jgi:hypothetical protein
MRGKPIFTNSFWGWVVPRLFSSFDSKDSAITVWVRLANYPIGIAGFAISTWVSQNPSSLYNKIVVIGIFISGITVMFYYPVRRFWTTRRQGDMAEKN